MVGEEKYKRGISVNLLLKALHPLRELEEALTHSAPG
jgi:hypothetical protein